MIIEHDTCARLQKGWTCQRSFRFRRSHQQLPVRIKRSKNEHAATTPIFALIFSTDEWLSGSAYSRGVLVEVTAEVAEGMGLDWIRDVDESLEEIVSMLEVSVVILLTVIELAEELVVRDHSEDAESVMDGVDFV